MFSSIIVSALCVIANVAANPAVTPPPQLFPRQNSIGDNLVGYFSINGEYASMTCGSGLTWTDDSKYGHCCSTGLDCFMPTTCDGSSSVIYSGSATTTTVSCSSGLVCFPDYIYENIDDDMAVTWYGCDYSRDPIFYYQTVDDLSVISTTTRTSATTSPEPDDSSDSASIAWIAGPIVGGVVGLALIAALMFWLIRRRKRVNENAVAASQPNQHQEPYTQQYYQQQSYYQHGQPSPMPGYMSTGQEQQFDPRQSQMNDNMSPPPPSVTPGWDAKTEPTEQHQASGDPRYSQGTVGGGAVPVEPYSNQLVEMPTTRD